MRPKVAWEAFADHAFLIHLGASPADKATILLDKLGVHAENWVSDANSPASPKGICLLWHFRSDGAMRSSDRVTKLLLYSVVLPFFLGCSDPDPQNSKPLARAASQQGAETTLRAYNVALQTYKTELQLREKLEQELASAISSFQLETQRGHQMFAEAIRSDLEQERLIEHSGGSDEEKARKLKSLSDLAEERLQAHKDRYKWRVAAYNTFSADLNRRIEDQRARVKTAERIRDQAARHLPTQTD